MTQRLSKALQGAISLSVFRLLYETAGPLPGGLMTGAQARFDSWAAEFADAISPIAFGVRAGAIRKHTRWQPVLPRKGFCCHFPCIYQRFLLS